MRRFYGYWGPLAGFAPGPGEKKGRGDPAFFEKEADYFFFMSSFFAMQALSSLFFGSLQSTAFASFIGAPPLCDAANTPTDATAKAPATKAASNFFM
jgi:hypothetical protein